MAADQPGVDEHVLGADPLARLLAQQAPDQALRPGGERVWKGEVTSTDFGEQTAVLSSMKRVSEIGAELDKCKMLDNEIVYQQIFCLTFPPT